MPVRQRPSVRGPARIGTRSGQFVIPIRGVNFFCPVILQRGFVIGKREDRQAFAVVEIALVQTIEKENESRYHQGQAEEDEDDDHFHVGPFVTRSAVRVTTATELAGMNTAAATGVTSPAAQQATATML